MRPIDYLKEEYHNGRHWQLEHRSKKILEFFEKYVDKEDKILELGCSSGRNLVYLKENGYNNLTGLEMFNVKDREEFKLIRGRWENIELDEYDVIFSASFLQEFSEFPHELFSKTLQKCRRYFIIFGDYTGDYFKTWEHPDFEIIEQINSDPPFSQPIIVIKKYDNNRQTLSNKCNPSRRGL